MRTLYIKLWRNFKRIHGIFSSLLILLLYVFSSCEKEIQVDLPQHDPMIVANSFFSPDCTWTVYLSNSLAILDRENINSIDNGTVSITDNNNNSETLLHKGAGVYKSSVSRPLNGKTYTLKVAAPSYNSIDAVNHIPTLIPIVSVALKDSAFIGRNKEERAEITIRFRDLPSETNYYQAELIMVDLENNYYQAPIGYNLSFQTNDPSLNIEDQTSIAFFNDEFFNGKLYDLKLNIESAVLQSYSNSQTPQKKKIAIKLYSVSKAYYMYSKTYKNYVENNGNPFAEPVQVYNNINKGLGIFAGFTLDTDTVHK